MGCTLGNRSFYDSYKHGFHIWSMQFHMHLGFQQFWKIVPPLSIIWVFWCWAASIGCRGKVTSVIKELLSKLAALPKVTCGLTCITKHWVLWSLSVSQWELREMWTLVTGQTAAITSSVLNLKNETKVEKTFLEWGHAKCICWVNTLVLCGSLLINLALINSPTASLPPICESCKVGFPLGEMLGSFQILVDKCIEIERLPEYNCKILFFLYCISTCLKQVSPSQLSWAVSL